VSEPASPGQPAIRHANKRGAARLAAVQALYQMDVAGSGVFEITAEYEAFRLGKEVDGALYREADAQWFRAILTGVVENQKTIDPVIRQALTEDWPLSRLDSTLRAILRAGVYELMKRDDVPVAVTRGKLHSRIHAGGIFSELRFDEADFFKEVIPVER